MVRTCSTEARRVCWEENARYEVAGELEKRKTEDLEEKIDGRDQGGYGECGSDPTRCTEQRIVENLLWRPFMISRKKKRVIISFRKHFCAPRESGTLSLE